MSINKTFRFIKNLIINDCYNVPDKLKFNLPEGWSLSKHYLILCDTKEGFKTLNSAFQDVFINYDINSNSENELSGIGINDEIFSGKLTEEDISYVPYLKKFYPKNSKTFVYKFHKQMIIVSTDPQEVFTQYGKTYLTENDIGFFSVKENNIDFASNLKDYKEFIATLKQNHRKQKDFLNAIYNHIIDGRFLFKPQNSSLYTALNLSDTISKKRYTMEEAMNKCVDDITSKMKVDTSEENSEDNLPFNTEEVVDVPFV